MLVDRRIPQDQFARGYCNSRTVSIIQKSTIGWRVADMSDGRLAGIYVICEDQREYLAAVADPDYDRSAV